ncbi:hypothetical protein KEM60_01927 [Austwickia sp. TVS 96-490-7B]|uniref:GNAT family N-acetyltransferase n=1 Tax=Austwickia sp. TVS 96-490-7B TaxID=2830843 RepID=UPI001C5679F4|nr:GNAT family N-acetyltransferase [Austwickia sp. TVS 96-490-7B]MBW3085719.1 hypothetical protein [Austwickia sp. TVS 96-490-7B]
MKIGLLTQWYDPEPGPAALPGVLARGLAERGHDVRVLTGIPNYPTGEVHEGYKATRAITEKMGGVTVHRVPLYPSHDASAVHRIANYSTFGTSALIAAPHIFSDVDALWVNYSPITVGPAQWAAKYLRSVPSVVHVLDLWPDTVMASGRATSPASSQVLRGLNYWCKAMYGAADSVAYISPGVGKVLQERGVAEHKLHYVPMWADENIFYPTTDNMRAQLGISEEATVLLYAGALGVAQNLRPLIQACAMLPRDGSFVAIIAGSGTEEQSLRSLSSEIASQNIRFIGRVPQQEMTSLISTADLCYISLNDHPHAQITLPSKTQSTFASSRAVILNGKGDAAEILRDADAGWVCNENSPEGISNTLMTAMSAGRLAIKRKGENGRKYYLRNFSQKVAVENVEKLLQNAASSSNHPASLTQADAELLSSPHQLHYRSLRQSDPRAAAKLHIAAFPNFFLSQLGEQFLTEFYRAFINDESSISVVATHPSGALAGICVGTSEPHGFYSRLVKKRVIPFALASAQASLKNPRAIPRLLRGFFYRGEAGGQVNGALLASICVDPSIRISGVGQQLITRWMSAASSQCDSAFLTTDANGNDHVNRFYQRAGWSIESTFSTPEGRRMNRYQHIFRS